MYSARTMRGEAIVGGGRPNTRNDYRERAGICGTGTMSLVKSVWQPALRVSTATVLLCAWFLSATATISRADESGTSFWLPGTFGSLAAAPEQPGWAFASVYYHTSVSAGADVARSRELQIGNFNPNLNVNLNATLKANADLALLVPSYTFATPVFGGQLAVQMGTIVGRTSASINGTLSASLPPFSLLRTDSIGDSVTGFGDLYPQASLKWNSGLNNFMTYITGDIPVGDYSSTRLANLGLGHGAIDGGAGYTYFNPATGREFSAVTGLTYNFTNPVTNYQSGVDWHLDWGASQFVSKQVHVGLIGYVYQQLTADSGQAAILGDFKSRAFAVGPQIGFIFPVGEMQGYLNLKAYKEFAAENRPEGWNGWLTLAVSPAAAPPPLQSTLVHK
jgi:hypothetical protein